MKPSSITKVIAIVVTLISSTYLTLRNELITKEKSIYIEPLYETNTKFVASDIVVPKKPERIEVYDNLTMDELIIKLDKNLKNELSGMGKYYAKYSIEMGVDPYLAVAISMHETGCTWSCSTLAKRCNNIGGQKGSGCGEYQAFNTLEDGIYGFISNIKRNYVDYGLLDAVSMNPKYAEDPMWSSKVNKYVNRIKNS